MIGLEKKEHFNTKGFSMEVFSFHQGLVEEERTARVPGGIWESWLIPFTGAGCHSIPGGSMTKGGGLPLGV